MIGILSIGSTAYFRPSGSQQTDSHAVLVPHQFPLARRRGF